MLHRFALVLLGTTLLLLGSLSYGQPMVPAGDVPKDSEGRELNLGFESGTLDDWTASGNAFDGQPVRGDVVATRRNDMRSDHDGEYWIGTFEVAGDAPQGTLTSAKFAVTAPWGTFLIAGGGSPKTRVELVRAADDKVIYQASGDNTEELKYAIVDLRAYADQEIYIRIVDESSAGWGHINFDDFRFHAERPSIPPLRSAPMPDVLAHAGLTPEEAAKAMTLPAGFRATLFAGEPDVHQPIAAALDDRGRLWVAEAYSYPHRLKPHEANDRIIIFEDSDGDGRFDSKKLFVDKLNLVSGLALGFGGVWVGAAPELLFIPDRDGDDVPDGPAEVLLDGWGYQDTHETLNAFTWGPDGWLYGCHGVFTHSLVGKPGAAKPDRVPLNAAIWRYHPTRHEFEVFSHGTSNPWGVDFDDHGETFLTACVIPHLFHVIPGARYHRQAGSHFNRHTYDDIKTIADHVHWVGGNPHAGNNRSDVAGGGHAHSGAMIYLGDAWPEEYRGQIFMNNIHGARINVDSLERAGSGYVGHHEPDFLLANDQWSQILNLYYGPDGQVYIIDWYDANQCHRYEREVHDRSNGRIFKISYGDRRLLPVDLAPLSDLQLVDLQLHKNDWYVRHARRLLQERAAQRPLEEGVRERLVAMALENHDETRRLRGLWALHVTGLLDDELIQRGLENDREFVRAWTGQLAGEQPDRLTALLPKLTAMARNDSSQIVRRYLASLAQRIPAQQRLELLAALTSHTEDVGDHNLPLLYWYALEPTIDVDPARALAIAEQSPIALLLNYTSRRIASDAQAQGLALLVDALDGTSEAATQRSILDGANRGLVGRRKAPRPESWSTVSAKLAASDDEQVRQQARALAVTLGDPQALAEMRRLILDSTADLEARRGALGSLLGVRDDDLAETLHALLKSADLRSDALRGLAAYDHPHTPQVVLAEYGTFDPQLRREALATLAARKAYANALLDALADSRVPAADVSADIIRQLRNHKDSALNERIREVWGEARDTSADVAARIEQYRKLFKSKPKQEPDLALGRAMFVKTCQQCHTLFGIGGKVGPELTGSNRADLEYLLSNMLDPSALIAKDYMASVVVTTDGRVLTGILREADDRVTLIMQNETITLPREEIDQIEASEKSMMPDDVLQPLSEHEARSLVAYLASPTQTPLLATADTVQGFFNGVDLSGWRGDEKLWSVEGGEIVGRSPGIKHNEFLVSDLEAGDFRLRLQVKLTPNIGNSGVQFRSKPLDDGEVQGYQADIGAGWWGKLYEERGRGLLWSKSGEKHVRPGEWNDYEIHAQESRIRTYINGNLCTDLEDTAGAKRGIFALQIHSGPAMEVRFRNLQLELEPETELASQAGTAGE